MIESSYVVLRIDDVGLVWLICYASGEYVMVSSFMPDLVFLAEGGGVCSED